MLGQGCLPLPGFLLTCARSVNEAVQLLAALVPGDKRFGASTLNAQHCHSGFPVFC